MMRRDRERYATGWAWSDRLLVGWFRWRADREERRLRALLEQLSREREEDGRG